MNQRKVECCDRLHYDALRRLGLPLPEYANQENEPTTADLLDAKFETPSIYQAIQQGLHAPLAAFQSTETQLRKNQLDLILAKYRNWKVPQDKLRDVFENLSDDPTEEDFEDLGDLPVLMVNLAQDQLLKTTDESEG